MPEHLARADFEMARPDGFAMDVAYGRNLPLPKQIVGEVLRGNTTT
jgi:hypothetical protein